jgi:hypothetical protein
MRWPLDARRAERERVSCRLRDSNGSVRTMAQRMQVARPIPILTPYPYPCIYPSISLRVTKLIIGSSPSPTLSSMPVGRQWVAWICGAKIYGKCPISTAATPSQISQRLDLRWNCDSPDCIVIPSAAHHATALWTWYPRPFLFTQLICCFWASRYVGWKQALPLIPPCQYYSNAVALGGGPSHAVCGLDLPALCT